MPPKSKTTLTDSQKYELCLYARDNKKSRVKSSSFWVEEFFVNSWGRYCSEDVDDSTEIAAISASMTLQGLETVQAFLLCDKQA